MKRVLAYAVLRVGQGEASAPQSVGGYSLFAATYRITLYTSLASSPVVHSHVKQCVSLHPISSLSTEGVPAVPMRPYA